MKFTKDIFISYAHIDDESLIEGENGWITEFHRALEIRLAQLLGYKPNIWRDKELDGNHDFSAEIYSELTEIAVMVSVHSPRYVKSDWCVKEVNEFYKVSENNIGAKIGTKSRIFKVIKTPVELSLQPQILQGLLGYDFFKIDPISGKPKEFSALFGKEAQLAFWSKLDDLAHDIASLLEEITNKISSTHQEVNSIKTGANQIETNSISNNTNVRKIYLAETSYDIKENRDSIFRMLLDKGFTVLPDKNLSLIFDEYSSDVSEMINECELSIHLIGSNFGLVPEGTDKSKIQLQNEIASNISNQKKLNRLIWMPPSIEIKDERQQSFVDELKRSEELLNGADLLISSLEDLEFAIEDKTKEIKKDIIEEDDDSESDRAKQIYLICDQADQDSIVALDNYLFDKGFEVIKPIFEGDQTELRLDHQENLKNCDAVLIYYGAGNELWLRAKTRDFLKIAGYGRKKPLDIKLVCLAPPFDTQKERFRSHEITVVSLQKEDFSVLDDFIKEIKK